LYDAAVPRSDDVDSILAAFLGNPFDVDDSARERAEAAIAGMDVGAAISKLLRSGDEQRAKSLILSVGHHQARRDSDPKKVLDAAVLPPSVARKLPRPRSAYLRICTAAGRCFQVLAQILGSSEAMVAARRHTWAACFGGSLLEMLDLEKVIRDHDVLVLGETGTGKEHFASAMMAATPGGNSGQRAPHSAINAAAIPEALVESELFGHVKGAFTGATDTREGRIRGANGGAFFLDEVGDLPSKTQVKLLRVIETNDVYPVGSDSSFKVDLRYIAATHKNLEEMAERREFRRDLFERLAGNIIRITPLRDRPEDILAIGQSFVRRHLDRPVHQPRVAQIEAWLRSREARSYRWPGNVRELQNSLRNMMLGLAPALSRSANPASSSGSTNPDLPGPIAKCEATLEQVEDWYIHRVLHHEGKNYSRSARRLGIDRSTVKRRTGKPAPFDD